MATSSLVRDFSGSPTSDKICTFSVWVRRHTDEGVAYIFSNGNSANTDFLQIGFDGNRKFFYTDQQSGGNVLNFITQAEFSDTTAWYNFIIQNDTTQSTESDRVKIYVNGVQVTSFATESYPSQNQVLLLTKEASGTSTGWRFNGRSSDAYGSHVGQIALAGLTDGVADYTLFGEFDSTTGVWKPKTSPTISGTNKFLLKFEDSSNLGLDSSGAGNFTVSGNVKQSPSTPSNKFPALNPRGTSTSYKTNTYNLDAGHTFFATTGVTRVEMTDMCFAGGKWYWEAKIEKANNSSTLGVFLTDSTSAKRIWQSESVGDLSLQSASNGGNGAISFLAGSSSLIQQGNSTTSYGTGISDGDIIMFAFDADNGKVWTGRNGTWFNAPGTSNAGDPAAGTNDSGKTLTNTDRELMAFYVAGQNSDSTNRLTHTNFGDGYFATTAVASANADGAGMGAFEYAVPSGFYAVCSKNIQDYGG